MNTDGAGTQPRLLALRALGLGDLLTAVPALRALRRAHPAHEVVLAAPAWLVGAADATGAVDRLLPTEAPRREVPSALEWTGPPPEIAVDLHGNGPLSRMLLESVRPGRLWSYDGPGPRWRAGEHERARWCRLLRWHGVPADDGDLRIPAPALPSPAPGAVVLHPGAEAGARRWPAARFAEAAAALRAGGHAVVVTGGPGEERLAHAVAAQGGLAPSAVFAGRTGLPFAGLAALVAGAAAVIVGDTGIAHLATALGAPSVVLFGPVSPRVWGPPPLPRHRILWHPDSHPGDPHAARTDPRLLRIGTDEVLAAFDELQAAAAEPTRKEHPWQTPRSTPAPVPRS